jgi:glycosyltransferase involved in cell wall biosynthesis
MLDLATFRALTRDCYGAHLPAALYMHENQLTYPLPPGRTRDLSFAWINYTSMLAADAVFFNSDFHRHSLLAAVREWLSRYHDYQELEQVDALAAKAQVLPPGIDLAALDVAAPVQAEHADPHTTAAPIILWNSRWEYDKQPEAFFAALEELEQRGADFRLIVAGEHVDPAAPDFAAARRRWAQRVLHWGYAPQHAAYARLLHQADVVVSSAIQEFFGIGVIEALSCGCIPVLPHRLSYPELLPPEHHADCLYPAADALAAHLHTTLQRRDELRRRDWRAIAAPYDWAHMAPRYDAAFASVQGIGARR